MLTKLLINKNGKVKLSHYKISFSVIEFTIRAHFFLLLTAFKLLVDEAMTLLAFLSEN